MHVFSAYYEDGNIIPIGNPVIPNKRKLIITVLDEDIHSSTPTTRPPFPIGCMSGKVWMADDFNAPLEDFNEYME